MDLNLVKSVSDDSPVLGNYKFDRFECENLESGESFCHITDLVIVLSSYDTDNQKAKHTS